MFDFMEVKKDMIQIEHVFFQTYFIADMLRVAFIILFPLRSGDGRRHILQLPRG